MKTPNILNPLATSAHRFQAAQKAAWIAHPPPCLDKPGILPCDQGEDCSLCFGTQTCPARSQLKQAIETQLNTPNNQAPQLPNPRGSGRAKSLDV